MTVKYFRHVERHTHTERERERERERECLTTEDFANNCCYFIKTTFICTVCAILK
jgi:hypothetical protein